MISSHDFVVVADDSSDARAGLDLPADCPHVDPVRYLRTRFKLLIRSGIRKVH